MSVYLKRFLTFIDRLYFPEDYEQPKAKKVFSRTRTSRKPRKKLIPSQGKSDNLINISQANETISKQL